MLYQGFKKILFATLTYTSKAERNCLFKVFRFGHIPYRDSTVYYIFLYGRFLKDVLMALLEIFRVDDLLNEVVRF